MPSVGRRSGGAALLSVAAGAARPAPLAGAERCASRAESSPAGAERCSVPAAFGVAESTCGGRPPSLGPASAGCAPSASAGAGRSPSTNVSDSRLEQLLTAQTVNPPANHILEWL